MYSKALRRLDIRRSASYIFSTSRHASTIQNEDHIIGSTWPDLEIPNQTIPEFVFQKWSKYPDRVALECAVTGKKYTFEELRKKSINLCASFRKKLNLQKGDVIGIILPNTPEYAVCVLGALQAGLIVTTLTPLSTAEEITRHLSETATKAVVTFTPLVPLVQKCASGIQVIAIKISMSDSFPVGVVLFSELIDTVGDAVPISIDTNDVALMPSSSGTTGFPKAVELTHRNIIANVSQLSNLDLRGIVTSTDNYQGVVPATLPFFHVAGLLPTLFCSLYNMSKLVTLPKFDPETFTRILQDFKPTFLILVPYIVGFLTNHPSIQKKHFESIKMIASSAAPLSALDEQRLIDKAGDHVDMVQAYGMTESTAIITISGKENTGFSKGSGSVGKPLQNTFVKVVDETGKALGPNLPGEILIKGPQLMKGYHKKLKETQDTFVDGWLKTGDIGFYNENNMLYVTDRLKELIKVKGFQVAPAELEAAIRDHSDVFEAAVVGIPHNVYGEVPRAYVVLKQNKSVNSEEIVQFVANKVASYKQLLGGVEFVKSLPKAPSGKIIRKQLIADFEKNEASKNYAKCV